MEKRDDSKAKTQAPGSGGAAERPAVRYPTAQLLKSKALSEFQEDFARAILTEPEYAVKDALDALNKFFEGGGR